MSKDPLTPERYAVDAMHMAIGALRMSRKEGDGSDEIVERLRRAIDKFDPRCEHDWAAAQSPNGGVQGTCKKCGVTRYVS